MTVHKVCPNGKALDSDRFAITNNGTRTGSVLDCGESADVAVAAGQQFSLDELGAGTPAADLANYTELRGDGCTGTLEPGLSCDVGVTPFTNHSRPPENLRPDYHARNTKEDTSPANTGHHRLDFHRSIKAAVTNL